MSNVIPFGFLYMRPLQWLETTAVVAQDQVVFPEHNTFRMIKVTCRCLCTLLMWKKPWFLFQGPVLGASCHCNRRFPHRLGHGLRRLLNSGSMERSSSLMEHKFPGDNGCISSTEVLPPRPQRLSCSCPVSQHIGSLVYKSSGGLWLRPLCKLGHQILLWAQGKLLSLRAVFIPGYLNRGNGAWVMETAPQDIGVDLEKVGPGGR